MEMERWGQLSVRSYSRSKEAEDPSSPPSQDLEVTPFNTLPCECTAMCFTALRYAAINTETPSDLNTAGVSQHFRYAVMKQSNTCDMRLLNTHPCHMWPSSDSAALVIRNPMKDCGLVICCRWTLIPPLCGYENLNSLIFGYETANPKLNSLVWGHCRRSL